MITFNNTDMIQALFAGLKIAIMIAVVMHLLFLIFILKQISGMRRLLSTFNQFGIEIMGITHVILLLIFLIYVILLPQ